MDVSTLMMMVAALVLLTGVYLKTPELAGAGLKASTALLFDVLPRVVAARVAASILFPLLAGWLSEVLWRRFTFEKAY